ncbi:Metallo-dependent phosphatase [Pyrenophora tritici-repentis]|nr:Metallo-dependent phosphatase [Pyrenophora tritici-repentis]
MSLKVLGKWKRWGKSMDSKFSNIQTSLQKNSAHAFHEPSPTSPVSSPVQKKHPRIGKMAGESKDGDETEDPDAEEDEDDGAVFDDSFPIAFTERQVEVVRKVMRKWWRVAGLKGNPVPCDELGGGEFQVNWTKAIAPRLEGRIVEVGKGVVSVEA